MSVRGGTSKEARALNESKVHADVGGPDWVLKVISDRAFLNIRSHPERESAQKEKAAARGL